MKTKIHSVLKFGKNRDSFDKKMSERRLSQSARARTTITSKPDRGSRSTGRRFRTGKAVGVAKIVSAFEQKHIQRKKGLPHIKSSSTRALSKQPKSKAAKGVPVVLPGEGLIKLGDIDDVMKIGEFFYAVWNIPDVYDVDELVDDFGASFDIGRSIRVDKAIGQGQFSRIFLAHFISNPAIKMVLKVNKEILHHAAEEDPDAMMIESVLREYSIMSRLDCEGPTGITVCLNGGLVLQLDDNHRYFAFVLEVMDGDLFDWVKAMSSAGLEENLFVRLFAALTQIKRLRSIHRLGVFHLDAHPGNFLVKWKHLKNPLFPDIRMADFGRACDIDPSKETSCVAMAHLGFGSWHNSMAHYDVMEYIQLLSSVVDVFSPVFVADSEYNWSIRTDEMFNGLKRDHRMMYPSYLKGKLLDVMPPSGMVLTFEQWINKPRGVIEFLQAVIDDQLIAEDMLKAIMVQPFSLLGPGNKIPIL